MRFLLCTLLAGVLAAVPSPVHASGECTPGVVSASSKITENRPAGRTVKSKLLRKNRKADGRHRAQVRATVEQRWITTVQASITYRRCIDGQPEVNRVLNPYQYHSTQKSTSKARNRVKGHPRLVGARKAARQNAIKKSVSKNRKAARKSALTRVAKDAQRYRPPVPMPTEDPDAFAEKVRVEFYRLIEIERAKVGLPALTRFDGAPQAAADAWAASLADVYLDPGEKHRSREEIVPGYLGAGCLPGGIGTGVLSIIGVDVIAAAYATPGRNAKGVAQEMATSLRNSPGHWMFISDPRFNITAMGFAKGPTSGLYVGVVDLVRADCPPVP